jgi:membrane protein implicated in regulation of membrane protease activity
MQRKRAHRQYWKWLPIGIMLLCMIWFLEKGRSISWQELSSLMPETLWQAVLLFWGCYAIKSLSAFIAITSLFVCRRLLKDTINHHKEQDDENSNRNRQ